MNRVLEGQGAHFLSHSPNSRLIGPRWEVTGRGRLLGSAVHRQLKAIVKKEETQEPAFRSCRGRPVGV